MFQAPFTPDNEGEQPIQTSHKDTCMPSFKQDITNLYDKGPDYIPPPPHSMLTVNHPQINTSEDQPLQDLHPDVITPKQHSSYQI